MEKDQKVARHFTLASDLTDQVCKLADEQGLSTDQALNKFLRLGLMLASFKTGDVTVYVKQADGSEDKIYPAL